MDRETRLIRRRQWLHIITECNNRDQGMSKAQWCEANGIDRRQFYYWQRILRQEAAQQREAMIVSQPGGVTHREFVDITSLGGQSGETSHNNTAALVPELMIKAGDYQVYVSSVVQEPTLRKVLHVIRNA